MRGWQVNRLLDESEVWQAYRGQRHDLFLPAGASAKVWLICLVKGIPAAWQQQQRLARNAFTASAMRLQRFGVPALSKGCDILVPINLGHSTVTESNCLDLEAVREVRVLFLQAGVMGLLQGDQVTRFALPPPPGSAPAPSLPTTTADPAVMTSQPVAAPPSPGAAATIVLPAPETSPEQEALPHTDMIVAAVATGAAAAAAQPDAARQEEEAHAEPLFSPPAPAQRLAAADGQLSSEAAAGANPPAVADEHTAHGAFDSGTISASRSARAGPVSDAAAAMPAQSPAVAHTAVDTPAGGAPTAATAYGEASVEQDGVRQVPSVPCSEPEAAAARSMPPARLRDASAMSVPVGVYASAIAACPGGSVHTNVASIRDSTGRIQSPSDKSLSCPDSTMSSSRSTQVLPCTPNVPHADAQAKQRSQEPQEAVDQVDYGPLGPLG